ncbi:MAG: FG-GAP repeat domain-containing protein [Akkermansiaceae bacterium]
MIRLYLLLTVSILVSSGSAAPLDRLEQLSSQAGGVLKHVGKYFSGSLTKKDLDAELAQQLQVKIEVPDVRWNPIPGRIELSSPSGNSPIAQSLTSLEALKAHWGGKVLRTKFKIIETRNIGSSETNFSTRQLVAIFVQTSQGLCEINTEWQATWTSANNTVKLVSLTGNLGTESRLQGTQPLYQDLTNSLIRLSQADMDLIKRGANHWLPRAERASKPEFFALSGISVADVNGDGREDFYLCQLGGLPNSLFIQQADGTFVNRASEWGVDFHDNSTCALFVDFDNDGDQDMALASAAGLAILENDQAKRFRLKKLHREIVYSYSLCAADYDRDGSVDLYACRYYGSQTVKEGQHSVQGNIPVPHPVYDARNGGQNTLVRNLGGLTFEDVTQSVGLNQENNRFTYAAMWEDWDNDGDQDLYVANDFGGNNYYRNDDGKFSVQTSPSGLSAQELSMGVCAGDFNGDGWPDIHVCNMFSSAGSRVTRQQNFKKGVSNGIVKQFQTLAKGNSLYTSKGKGIFSPAGEDAGITVGRWSWASLAPDINNDGWDDLLVANGFITGKQPDDL